MKPVRLQRSRKKGSRLTSPNGLPVVCVGRGGMWGNPFRQVSEREAANNGTTARTKRDCVIAFKSWLHCSSVGQTVAYAATRVLRGKNLACWCKPGEACHADVLLEIANESAAVNPDGTGRRAGT